MTTTDRLSEKVIVAKAMFRSDLETAVIKSTKRNSKVPKKKWVIYLLNATYRRDVSIDDLGKLLGERLRDSSWNVVFKTLIVTHILLDDGSNNRLIGYLASNPSILNLSSFRDKSGSPLGIEQTKNIRSYASYLEEKVHVYRETKKDFCRISSSSYYSSSPVYDAPRSYDTYGTINNEKVMHEYGKSFRNAAVEENFLKEMSIVIRQTEALVKCKFHLDELDNPISLEAFRLLIRDLLRLVKLMTEGVVNMLERFTQLPKHQGHQALNVYKSFVTVSPKVTEFLNIAKRSPLEQMADINLSMPPASLSKTLEDYLSNPNSPSSIDSGNPKLNSCGHPSQQPPKTLSGPSQPSPTNNGSKLIDLFGSIEEQPCQFIPQQQQKAPQNSFFEIGAASTNGFSNASAYVSHAFYPDFAGNPTQNSMMASSNISMQPANFNYNLSLHRSGIAPSNDPFGMMLSPPLNPSTSMSLKNNFGGFVGNVSPALSTLSGNNPFASTNTDMGMNPVVANNMSMGNNYMATSQANSSPFIGANNPFSSNTMGIQSGLGTNAVVIGTAANNPFVAGSVSIPSSGTATFQNSPALGALDVGMNRMTPQTMGGYNSNNPFSLGTIGRNGNGMGGMGMTTQMGIGVGGVAMQTGGMGGMTPGMLNQSPNNGKVKPNDPFAELARF